ncbi:MAG: NTP transferase domain-containing protein [Thermoplasma acidophilum]|nr:NTP transferase domain-containing protein [Thermoplasma acidophilum]
MICLIMAGGLGSRMNRPEKALIEVHGETLLDRTIRCMNGICSDIYALIDPSMERLQGKLRSVNVKVLAKRRGGYIEDLNHAMHSIGKFPILVIPGDIFIFNCSAFLDAVRRGMLAEANVVSFTDAGQYTGISIFNAQSGSYQDIELNGSVANINTPEDLRAVIERLRTSEKLDGSADHADG